MNRSIWRVAIFMFLIGLFGFGSSASGQTNGGWQRGDEPLHGAGARPLPQQSAGRPQNILPAAGGQVAPQPQPFTLTAQEEAKLDQTLIAWERQSSTIKTYKCEFERLEYGTVFGQNPKDRDKPRTISKGELKYSTPDKGMFKLTSIRFYNPKTGEHEPGGLESLEHWVCDGKSIFEINHKEKTRTERRLPPEMQGTAISEGPLPFVFGAKAARLKSRYWMRDVTPPANAGDAIWLEAHPRFQADAANFKFVEIIIGRTDFMPQAIKMYNPAFDPARGNDSTTVFVFRETSFNGAFDNVFKDFVAPDVPFHYKKIVLQPAVGQPTANNAPAPRTDPRSAQVPRGRLTR